MNAMECTRCDRPAHKIIGGSRLCTMHYRLFQMKTSAKRDGKTEPSYAELEALLDGLAGMRCPHCQAEMVWLRKDGAARVVTLQHDRSGRVRLLCLRCNSRHAGFAEDTFYDHPPGMLHCFCCKEWKNPEEFWVARRRPSGRSGECKVCSRKRNAAYKAWRRARALVKVEEG